MPPSRKFDAPAPPPVSLTAPAPGHADALPGSTPRLALPLHLSGAAAICVITGHAAVALLMTWSGWRPGPLTLLAVSAAVGMALSGGLLWVVGSWLGRRIDRITNVLERSQVGDYTQRVDASLHDDVGLLARRVKGDPRLQLRRRGLRTVPDSHGASIVFPPAEAALARTVAVCAAYTACRGPADLRLAVWVLAALLNAHPCPDGNGRLSRLVFAGVLARMGLTHAPVFALGPLKHASQGAFEITRPAYASMKMPTAERNGTTVRPPCVPRQQVHASSSVASGSGAR
jgi:HAMP domain-containing protein